jgi:hypothetical protein
LANAIRTKHLNPRKACANWKKGKRVCRACGYLIRLKGHKERCAASATVTYPPLVDVETEDEENEMPAAAAAAPTGLENEDEDEAPDVNNMIHTAAVAQQLATISLVAAHRVITEHQEQLAPRLERQDKDHEQLERMVQEV